MTCNKKLIGQVCLRARNIDTKDGSEKELLFVDVSSIDRSQKVVTPDLEKVGSKELTRHLKEIREGDILVSTVRPDLILLQ